MSNAQTTALIPPVLLLLIGISTAGSLSACPGRSAVQEPAAKAPLEVDETIEPPVRLSGPQPVYTEAARKEGIEATVRLRAIIDEEGRVKSLEALQEASHGLTEAAMDAIREWRFQPATLEGEPVAVFYELTVNFRLDEHREEDA